MINEGILKDAQMMCKKFKNDRNKVIASLRVFVLGSYKGEDKNTIDELRNEFLEKKIRAFLMEDFEEELKKEGISMDNLDLVFKYIWNRMNKSPNPLFILFAGLTAPESSGFTSELTCIANNKDMIERAYFFKHKEIYTISHNERYYTNCYSIENKEEFKKLAHDLVERKIEQTMKFIETL